MLADCLAAGSAVPACLAHVLLCVSLRRNQTQSSHSWLLLWRLIASHSFCTPRLQGFDTSQGKQHADAGAVKVKSTREGRQYMNRRVSYLH